MSYRQIQQTQRAALVTELPVVFVYEKENLDLIPLDLVGIQMQSKAAAVCGVNGGVLRLVRVVHHTILAVLDVGIQLEQLPDELDSYTEDEAQEWFMWNRYRTAAPSQYDYTEQLFTNWFKLTRRRGHWFAYHSIGRDV